MNDEQLQQIRLEATSFAEWWQTPQETPTWGDRFALEAIPALLAEVEQSREILQAIAAKHPKEWDGGGLDVVLQPPDEGLSYSCPWCDGHPVKGDEEDEEDVVDFIHTPDCPVTKARSILGL